MVHILFFSLRLRSDYFFHYVEVRLFNFITLKVRLFILITLKVRLFIFITLKVRLYFSLWWRSDYL